MAKNLLGTRLVTYQTDAGGQPVHSVLVCEDMYPVQRELYLGAVVDRGTRRVTFMASTEGGVEIEEVAHNTPEKILKVTVDPLVGLLPFQAREVGFQLGLNDEQIKQFTKLMTGALPCFCRKRFRVVRNQPAGHSWRRQPVLRRCQGRHRLQRHVPSTGTGAARDKSQRTSVS